MATDTLVRSFVPTEIDAARVLRTSLSRGGDWAELFWERHETLQLVLDDNRIEDAISGVDQGGGIRVTSGDRTTYANGNVADVDDLMALAGRAARGVAEGGDLHEPAAPEPDELPRHSIVAIDPRSVAVERKVALLRRANEVARALDPRVHQVTATYGESVQEVIVANSEGLHRTDTRVRLNLAVHVVAKQAEVLESGFEALRGTVGFELFTDDAVEQTALAAARRAGRLSDRGHGRARDEFEGLQAELLLVGVDAALARQAGQLAEELELRGYDAVHLASALALGSEAALVSWDEDLRRAATESGCAVAPAG
jgi:predicted Zn-dependent protease